MGTGVIWRDGFEGRWIERKGGIWAGGRDGAWVPDDTHAYTRFVHARFELDEMRVLRRLLARLSALILIARGPLDDIARSSFVRASGDAECARCGRAYSAHVHDPFEPWLTALCDGGRVKL